MQPWAVVSQGCLPGDPDNCPDTRGSIFGSNKSSTWESKGLYSLVVEENLGIFANGDWGLDTVTLGLPGSAQTAKMEKQIVAGIAAKDFYLAEWGIRPASTNLSNLNDPIPSLVNNLRDQGHIASLSWGYTAGAYYMSLQNKGSLGSLTLGGYDTARFTNSSTAWPMGPDTSRDLLVGLQAITVGDASQNQSPKSLLPTKSLAFIDSGVPHLWLPLDACRAFESAFGLLYNSTLDLYLVNSTQHTTLVNQNASVTLTLGSDMNSQPTVDVVMPYGAFDLTLTPNYPGVTSKQSYFPLHRAANASQVTLGRAFLQSAYVIADYERNTFQVHPAAFPGTTVQNLRAIPPLSASDGSSSTSASAAPALPTGAIVGIAIGALLAVFAASVLLFFGARLLRRRRAAAPTPPAPAHPGDDEPKLELDAPDAGLAGVYRGELAGRERKGELAATDEARGLMRDKPGLYRLKAELQGSEVSLEGTRRASRWGDVKAVNAQASELP